MNNKKNNANNKFGRVLAVPSLCELHPGICLKTEEKARKNLSQGPKRFKECALLRHPHIAKQFKTTTVQIKTNTTN
jgi:hypothetical protein